MTNSLRSLMGYSKGSPWENAPFNFIHTKNGSITMKNTKKTLKAFDGNTGKFLGKLKPGNEYKFNTDKVLEVPTNYYQQGGLNDCPDGYIKDETGQCIQDNGYNPTQEQEKGKLIIPRTNEAGIAVGGTGAKANKYGYQNANTAQPPTPIRKRKFTDVNNVVNTLQTGMVALDIGLSAFANHVEEGRQRKWNESQFANFNQTYSNAQNDYGVDPYEQTGQLRRDFKKGGIHINPANKGKFNALKARTGKSTEELTHSKNPLTRKRAIFAQNAAKWKHEEGGYFQEGGKFNVYEYLYGDDDKQKIPKVPISTPKKKQPKRVTEEEVDELVALGLDPMSLVNSENSYQNYRSSSSSTNGSVGSSDAQIIKQASEEHNIPAEILAGVYGAETSYGKNNRISSAGAQGAFQFMPATAKQYGVNVNDFASSANGAAKYLSVLYKKFGNWPQAIAAYNAGEGNISKGIYPKETQAYVPKVLANANKHKGMFQKGGSVNPSIVDFLKSKGEASDKDSRKKLAERYGVKNYNFSADKNTELLSKLRAETKTSPNKQPEGLMLDGSIRKGAYDPNLDVWDDDATAPIQKRVTNRSKSAYRKPATTPTKSVVVEKSEVQDVIPRFNMAPSTRPSIPNNNQSWMFGTNTPASKSKETKGSVDAKVIPTKSQYTQARLQESNAVNVGKNDVYHPLTNPEGYRPKFNKKVLGDVNSSTKGDVQGIAKSQQPNNVKDIGSAATKAIPKQQQGLYERFEKSMNKMNGVNLGSAGFSGDGSAIAYDYATMGKNWIDRKRAKSTPEDKTAIGKIKLPPKEAPFIPPIITGDTLRDDKRVFHMPMVADLNRINVGTRSRGQGYKEAPIESAGMLFSTMGGYGNSMVDTKTAKLEPEAIYVGADNSGKIKVGKGSDFVGKDYKASKYPSMLTTGFTKNPDGTYKQSPKAYNKQHGFALVNSSKGEATTNLILRKTNAKNKEDESNLYGRLAGGKIIIASPDFSKKIFVSGSVKNIDEQLEKFKKDNNLSEVLYIMPDNGSQGRTYQTTDQKITGDDQRASDLRDNSGGAGFYLKGRGYNTGGLTKAPKKFLKGGTFDMSEQEIQDLIKKGYKIERL